MVGIFWTSQTCALSLILENSQPLLIQIIVLFLFFLLVNTCIRACYTICSSPTGVRYSVLLFQFLSLCFSVWKFLVMYLQAYCFFPSAVSILMGLSKAFFIYVTVVLISSVSLLFFCRVSISLLMLPATFCLLSTFPIRALNILIIVILNLALIIPKLLSYISLIFTLSLQIVCVYCLFVCLFVLALCMPCIFLLRARHDVSGKRNWVK